MPEPEVRKRAVSHRLWDCIVTGTTKGLTTALWLLKFMIPVSFGVALLKWSGVLGAVATWIEPVFRLLGLPGEAAIVYISGAALNVYSGIAAMGPIALDERQITILGLMILIAHNLPIEGVVQSKAGANGIRILVLRVLGSFAAAAVVNVLIPAGGAVQEAAAAVESSGQPSFAEAMREWVLGSGWLVGKIGLFVIGVMVLQRLLEEFRVMPWLSRLLAWPLALIGLPRRTVFLWLVANTLGLAYGAAVIIEESRSGRLTKDETEVINLSVGVCHSLLEDTLLLVVVGAWPLWIVAPRLALAGLAVWGYRGWRRGMGRMKDEG